MSLALSFINIKKHQTKHCFGEKSNVIFFCPQVDSEAKMRKLLCHRGSTGDFSCVLVHLPYTDPFSDSQEIDLSFLTESEKDLIDHCELNWGYAQTPVIKLPEK